MFSPLMSEPAPSWWADRAVKNTSEAQNLAVANLGQLKHIANQAHAELESLVPSGTAAPFSVPATPDAAWYETQRKALNLGQLKAVAKPFYDRLNAISTDWVKGQLETNGLALNTSYFQATNGYYYPWNPSTPVEENYKVATVGQLKLVFALRFNQSTQNDGLPDLVKYQIINANPNDGISTLADVTPAGDFDGDGVNNLAEYQNQTSATLADSDGDGLSDRLQSGLLARWEFENNTGTTVTDSSINGFDGTLFNGANIDPNEGIRGGSLKLIDTTNGYLSLPHEVLDGKGTVTLSIWGLSLIHI